MAILYDKGPVIVPAEPFSDIYTPTTEQKYEIGVRHVTAKGDVFRYSRNGGVALTRAKMTQSKVIDTHYDNEVQTAYGAVAGRDSFRVLCTTGGLATFPNFAGGTLHVQDTASDISPMGDIYTIKSAIAVSETLFDVVLDSPLRNTILATAEITLIPNRWWDVVVFPTSTTGVPTGVPLADVPINYYFWAKTKGRTPVFVEDSDAIVIGNLVGPPASYGTAGAAGIWVTITQAWGLVAYVAAGAEVALIDLFID
jgi:hypothetical protein